MSAKVIDEFLMYYAVQKEGLTKKMDRELARFSHLYLGPLQERHINLFKAEYIVSRIFLKNGLIKKYLNHVAVKALPKDQYEYLQQQSLHSWKFSFAYILSNPADEFYMMMDVFTGEEYLLYSPSMKLTLKETAPHLWFNLIGFNGSCWQTFGIVLSLRSFDEDDIFFFATEVNPSIEDEDDLVREIEENPFPFFMLIYASNQPLVVNKGDELVNVCATDKLGSFDLQPFSKAFDAEWNEDVFQLKLRGWAAFPHCAVAYVDEKNKFIFRSALTDKGFDELTAALEKAGLPLPPDSDIRVSLSMVAAAGKILNRDIEINPYELLFTGNDDESEKDESLPDGHNLFLNLIIPYINENRLPDLKTLADQAGIDIETANELWNIVSEHKKERGL